MSPRVTLLTSPQGEDRAASILRAMARVLAGQEEALGLLRRLLEVLWPEAVGLVPPPPPVRALPESEPAPGSHLTPAETLALPIRRRDRHG